MITPEQIDADLARVDAQLTGWVDKYRARAAREGAREATVQTGMELAARVPEATWGLLAVAIRRLPGLEHDRRLLTEILDRLDGDPVWGGQAQYWRERAGRDGRWE